MLTPTHSELMAVLPEIILAVAAGLLLLIEAFLPRVRNYCSELTLLAIAGAGWARFSLPLPSSEVWGGMVPLGGCNDLLPT